MRIGQGYDVHKLTEGRKLILGGVDIPYEKGLAGHSDAFWDIPMRMCWFMPLWMRCWEQRRWEILDSIFRIQIRHIREYAA